MSAPRARRDSDVTRYILIAIALVAVAAILWLIADALVLAFGAIVFAAVLRAVADPLARWTGWRERWAVMATVGALLVVLGLFSWLFGAQTVRQFDEMRERLPEATEKFRNWIERSPAGRMISESVAGMFEGKESANGVALAAGAIATGLGHLLVIVFAGIYFALDPKLYRRGALRLLPPSRREQVGLALDDAGTALRKWLTAQLIVMAAVGTLTGIGLALIGVPLALSLGLLMGLLEFVPLIGPIAASIPGILLAFAKGPETALYATLVYIAVQQIESNLLTPLVQRWAVELAPVVALLSIVACGLLFGVLGMVFATPMAVVAMAMVQHLYVEDTLEHRRARPPQPRAPPLRR